MAQWSGTAIFSRKVWVSVVWAAFRERNFEVGEPFLRARSVPSKYCFFRTYASAKRIFLIKSHISPLFSSPYPFSSPFVCHLLATYLHRNLIGISSEPHRNLIEWLAWHQVVDSCIHNPLNHSEISYHSKSRTNLCGSLRVFLIKWLA